MKFSYSRTVLLVGLCLPLSAQAHRHRGRPVVVTVYEEAPPVFVTATAGPVGINDGSNDVVLPTPVPSVESFAESEPLAPTQEQEEAAEDETPPQPTTTPTEKVTVFPEAPTPKPEPATTTRAQDDRGLSGASLTISVTNRHGTPLAIQVGSNYGGPIPDGNPQPTTIASSVSYTFPIGWAGRIAVGKSLSGCNSLIEASYEPDFPRAIDVSYVDGYSVPITCSVDDVAVTGCNIELFDQGIACDSPLDNGACPNSARTKNHGPPAAFFAACQGSAYTFPKDDTATRAGITGLEISCCIGTSCPTPSLQKSHKRDLRPNPRANNGISEPMVKRESAFEPSQHLHQHQERHRWLSSRSHIHQLVQEAKMRR